MPDVSGLEQAPGNIQVDITSGTSGPGLRMHSTFDELASVTHDVIKYSASAMYDAFVSKNNAVR